MTIKKRLAQSNIAMLVIPLLVAAALVLLGMGAAGLLLAADGGVALPQRGERGDEQVPLDDPGPGLQPAGDSGVPHRAGRAPADEKGGMMTMGFMTPFHGFCMALAGSVPGVSGGTVAFILGFYDHFIGALHDLFGRDGTARKTALHYLLKLGAGWVIGMGLCVSLLANLFSAHIYFMSSPICCRRILLGVGLFLMFCEGYKLLFYYYVIGHGSFQWWVFPFQLCSIPMYLCVAANLTHSEAVRRTIYTFLCTYNLLGGFLALLEPSGLCHGYWTLTIHAFVWHTLLVFSGCIPPIDRQRTQITQRFRADDSAVPDFVRHGILHQPGVFPYLGRADQYVLCGPGQQQYCRVQGHCRLSVCSVLLFLVEPIEVFLHEWTVYGDAPQCRTSVYLPTIGTGIQPLLPDAVMYGA